MMPRRMANDIPGIQDDLTQRPPSPSALIGISDPRIGIDDTTTVKSIQWPIYNRLKIQTFYLAQRRSTNLRESERTWLKDQCLGWCKDANPEVDKLRS